MLFLEQGALCTIPPAIWHTQALPMSKSCTRMVEACHSVVNVQRSTPKQGRKYCFLCNALEGDVYFRFCEYFVLRLSDSATQAVQVDQRRLSPVEWRHRIYNVACRFWVSGLKGLDESPWYQSMRPRRLWTRDCIESAPSGSLLVFWKTVGHYLCLSICGVTCFR